MKKSLVFTALIMLALSLTSCGSIESAQKKTCGSFRDVKNIHSSVEQQTSSLPGEDEMEMKLNVQVGGQTFSATLEENAAVDALVRMMKKEPIVIQMSDYSHFEKVGSLKTSLPASNTQTTTQAGDIVLYNGNQIVIFYGSNSWSYTRLGKIDDLSGWEEALGSGDVTVTFSIEG